MGVWVWGFRGKELSRTGLVPMEDLKAPSLLLCLFFLYLSSFSHCLCSSVSSLSYPPLSSLPSLLREIPTRRQPSARHASALTRQQIGSCFVLSLLLWLSDRRQQCRKGMECLFGHRTASRLGRQDVVQEKGSRCDSRPHGLRGISSQGGACCCFLYGTHTQGESPLLS